MSCISDGAPLTVTILSPMPCSAARCLLTSALRGHHQLTAAGGWRLVAGGWLRCCRPCAGGASGAWPRPGHRNHPSHILGTGVAQHWRQWDRHCTCPVIAPFITCPHIASSLPTILDSLANTAHTSAVCSLKHRRVRVPCMITCGGETKILSV